MQNSAPRKRTVPAALIAEPSQQQFVSDRDAYLFGEQAPLVGVSPAKLQDLFPQGFTFAQARHLFDAWLTQTGTTCNEQTLNAMWIGFAHRACDLYYKKFI